MLLQIMVFIHIISIYMYIHSNTYFTISSEDNTSQGVSCPYSDASIDDDDENVAVFTSLLNTSENLPPHMKGWIDGRTPATDVERPPPDLSGLNHSIESRKRAAETNLEDMCPGKRQRCEAWLSDVAQKNVT